MRALLRLLALAGVLACALGAAARARAQDRAVPVTVTDVAGDRAFVTPGSAEGVDRGVRVTLGGRTYRVVSATATYATIEVGDDPPAIGDRGRARVRRAAGEPPPPLPPVQALATYRDLWRPPELPSASQHPDYVPLTAAATSRRVRLGVTATTGVLAPVGNQQGDPLVRTEIRAQLHAEPFDAVPLAFDADAAVQLYYAQNLDLRPGGSSRPLLVVRQLQATYGEAGNLLASIGRLRYVSNTVGQLDGARLQTPEWSGFSVAAFGGMVPNPTNGIPSGDTSRFGAELLYRDLERPWRPSASLTVHGSMFQGSIDERRIGGTVRLFPGETSIGSYFEVAFYGQGNPYDVGRGELSAIGADIASRYRALRWSARLDYRHPERSRWLANFLPSGFVCVAPRQSPDPTTIDPCGGGDDARYLGSADVGGQWQHAAVTFGTTYSRTPAAQADQLYGFAQVRALDLGGVARTDFTLAASHGSFMDAYWFRAGVGAAVLEGRLDISAYYRPTLRSYRSETTWAIDHLVGVAVYFVVSPEWQVVVDGDAFLGADVNAVLAMASVAWRPQIGSARGSGR